MASASERLTGYGLPTSIIGFNGDGDFDKFQAQIQQETYFSHVNLLKPGAQEILDQLVEEIATILGEEVEESAKNTGKLTYRENKKKDMLKEDNFLLQLLRKSVKARAKDIAFKTTAFVLNDKPTLPGAQAYQNLVKEYGVKAHNVADKYTEKQEVLAHFVSPNLLSPQIDVHLMTIADEHLNKFKYGGDVANDFYIEAVVVLVKNLPSNPTFLEVHLNMRKALAEGKAAAKAKEFFQEIAKDIQEKFKTLQDIQKVESANKATLFVKSKKFEKLAGAKQENCHNFEGGRPCAQIPCPYKHPKPNNTGKDDKSKASKTHVVKAKVAVVGEVVELSQIKSSFYVCSYSLQVIASQNICLDTGATATMSSDKKSFTDLRECKTPDPSGQQTNHPLFTQGYF